MSYKFDPGHGIDETSNASGYATWDNTETGASPETDGISARAPYGTIPFLGAVKICKKCLFTWAIVLVILVGLFLYRRK